MLRRAPAAARRRRWPALTVAGHPLAPVHAAGRASRSSPTAPPPRPRAASCSHADVAGRRVARGPRGVLRPPARRARAPRTSTARASARSPAVLHGAQDLLQSARPTAATRWCRSSTALVPEVDLRRRPRRRRRPARPGHRRSRGRGVSRHADRRRHDLPRLPRAARALADRQGAATPGCSTSHVHDLRDWTHDRHRTVDDTPYGGGAGMVMKPEPWGEALDAASRGDDRRRRWSCRPRRDAVHPGARPRARRRATTWSSPAAATRASTSGCSTSAATAYDVRELSLGDYVLNGGEVAALAIIEAVVRLLPGFMGNPESLAEESHEDGLLEYPVYTKPAALARPRRARRCCSPATTRAIAAWRHDRVRTPYRRPPPRPAHPAASVGLGGLDLEIRPATRADAGELFTLPARLLAAGAAGPTRACVDPGAARSRSRTPSRGVDEWTTLRRASPAAGWSAPSAAGWPATARLGRRAG